MASSSGAGEGRGGVDGRRGPPLLSIEGLRVRFRTYRGDVRALDGVDLRIYPGEFVGVVGETGAGKTVTALSVLRLLPSPPAEYVGGRILFEGRDLLALGEAEVARLRGNRISMVFQEAMGSLNPVYTAGFQIAESILLHQRAEVCDALLARLGNRRPLLRWLVARYRRRPRALLFRLLERVPGLRRWSRPLVAEAEARAVELLRQVRIADPAEAARKYPHELSGGMQQRVAIAMAMACRPALLIADEPTTALDVTIEAQILELFQALRREYNTAILLITHDLGVVAETCDRVAVMYAGSIVEEADVYRLFAEPKHPYTQGLLRALPAAALKRGALQPIEGSVPSLIDPPPGCPFHPRCPHAMARCAEAKPPALAVGPGHRVACWLYPEAT